MKHLSRNLFAWPRWRGWWFVAAQIGVAVFAALIVGVPTAHAVGFFGNLISFSSKTIVEGLLLLLSALISMEGRILTLLYGYIATVTDWQIGTTNSVVFDSWEIARDMVNLFFIVGLVVISFATMFRTFGVLRSYHWKTALPRLLIAAILVNLSLGISETVVLTSNRVTRIFANLSQRIGVDIRKTLGTDILLTSPLLATDVAPASRKLGNIEGTDRSLAPDGTQWEKYLQVTENRVQAENEFLEKCIAGERAELDPYLAGAPEPFEIDSSGNVVAPRQKTPGQCYEALAKARRGEYAVSGVERFGTEVVETFRQLGQFWGEQEQPAGQSPGGGLEYSGQTDAEKRLTLLASSFVNVLLLAVAIISVGCAVLFFIVRVAAIWVLMFLSAFAFGFMWISGNKALSNWWKYFLGWNIFGPYYMLVLIFGMMFMLRQNSLMAGLAGTGASVGEFPALGIIFQFIFMGIVFIGGLMLALNSSFAQAVKATPVLGAAAQRIGAFGALTAARAFGARAGRLTGMPAYYQARKEKLAQQFRALTPELLRLKTKEEQLAAARRRLGVAGGAQEELKMLKGRVTDERKALEARAELLDPKKRDDFLRSQIQSGNKAQALAAREMLLEKGKLSTEEVKDTEAMYGKGYQRREFGKQVEKAPDPKTAFAFANEKLDPSATDYIAKRDNLIEKFYGRVLTNPKAFAELSKDYNGNAAETRLFRYAAQKRWGPPGSRASNQAYLRLARDAPDGDRLNLAKAILT